MFESIIINFYFFKEGDFWTINATGYVTRSGPDEPELLEVEPNTLDADTTEQEIREIVKEMALSYIRDEEAGIVCLHNDGSEYECVTNSDLEISDNTNLKPNGDMFIKVNAYEAMLNFSNGRFLTFLGDKPVDKISVEYGKKMCKVTCSNFEVDEIHEIDLDTNNMPLQIDIGMAPDEMIYFRDEKKKYLMIVEDDYDFRLKFKGEFFTHLMIDSIEDVKQIEIFGAYGSPRTENTKCGNIVEWLNEVIDVGHLEPTYKGGGNHLLKITEAPANS